MCLPAVHFKVDLSPPNKVVKLLPPGADSPLSLLKFTSSSFKSWGKRRLLEEDQSIRAGVEALDIELSPKPCLLLLSLHLPPQSPLSWPSALLSKLEDRVGPVVRPYAVQLGRLYFYFYIQAAKYCLMSTSFYSVIIEDRWFLMQYFFNTYFCSVEGTVVKILSSERRLVSRQQIPLEQDTAVICVRNNMKLHKKK